MDHPALKGRHNSARASCAALSGLRAERAAVTPPGRCPAHPGRCPGLACYAPSGLSIPRGGALGIESWLVVPLRGAGLGPCRQIAHSFGPGCESKVANLRRHPSATVTAGAVSCGSRPVGRGSDRWLIASTLSRWQGPAARNFSWTQLLTLPRPSSI